MNRITALLLAALLALLLAIGGAYLGVVSQNPKGQPAGAATNYGPVNP